MDDSSSDDPELLAERVSAQLLDGADIYDLAAFALAARCILGKTFRYELSAPAAPAAGRLFRQLITAERAQKHITASP